MNTPPAVINNNTHQLHIRCNCYSLHLPCNLPAGHVIQLPDPVLSLYCTLPRGMIHSFLPSLRRTCCANHLPDTPRVASVVAPRPCIDLVLSRGARHTASCRTSHAPAPRVACRTPVASDAALRPCIVHMLKGHDKQLPPESPPHSLRDSQILGTRGK